MNQQQNAPSEGTARASSASEKPYNQKPPLKSAALPGDAHFTDIQEMIDDMQTVYSWKSPMRPYRKRSKRILRFYVALCLLLSVIIFFFGDIVLLIPVWALLFLFYVLTITPPPIVDHRITRFGVETANITVRWEVLSYFYFMRRMGYDVLCIVTIPPYNLHSFLVIPDHKTRNDVISLLGEHIVYLKKPPITLIDRLITFFSNFLPDDEDYEEDTTKPGSTSPGQQTPSAASYGYDKGGQRSVEFREPHHHPRPAIR